MSHVPHDLHEEFPEHIDALHVMKEKNAHFARLAAEYNDVNRSIYRVESQIEAMDDFALEELKKQRLHLKDEIAAILHG